MPPQKFMLRHVCITGVNDYIYKVVQIWPGLIACKQVTVCPGHIWTTLYTRWKATYGIAVTQSSINMSLLFRAKFLNHTVHIYIYIYIGSIKFPFETKAEGFERWLSGGRDTLHRVASLVS